LLLFGETVFSFVLEDFGESALPSVGLREEVAFKNQLFMVCGECVPFIQLPLSSLGRPISKCLATVFKHSENLVESILFLYVKLKAEENTTNAME